MQDSEFGLRDSGVGGQRILNRRVPLHLQSEHRRDLAALLHCLREGFWSQRLCPVADRVVGVGMHLDNQAVGAAGDGSRAQVGNK